MGMLRDLLDKLRAKKERYNEMEEQVQAQKRIQEKQLSSNERELQKYVEEERQSRIKNAVDYYRKKKNDEFMYGGQGWKDKRNIFKGHESIITGRKKRR